VLRKISWPTVQRQKMASIVPAVETTTQELSARLASGGSGRLVAGFGAGAAGEAGTVTSVSRSGRVAVTAAARWVVGRRTAPRW
jgi:hypothetical protein